jgi:hypothetical protein
MQTVCEAVRLAMGVARRSGRAIQLAGNRDGEETGANPQESAERGYPYFMHRASTSLNPIATRVCNKKYGEKKIFFERNPKGRRRCPTIFVKGSE